MIFVECRGPPSDPQCQSQDVFYRWHHTNHQRSACSPSAVVRQSPSLVYWIFFFKRHALSERRFLVLAFCRNRLRFTLQCGHNFLSCGGIVPSSPDPPSHFLHRGLKNPGSFSKFLHRAPLSFLLFREQVLPLAFLFSPASLVRWSVVPQITAFSVDPNSGFVL